MNEQLQMQAQQLNWSNNTTNAWPIDYGNSTLGNGSWHTYTFKAASTAIDQNFQKITKSVAEKVETALEWLDRRVDEMRVAL